MSVEDADKIGIKDNDWIEMVNRNGRRRRRAIVSTGCRRARSTCTTPGPAHRRALTETDGQARRHPQLADRILAQASNHIIGGYAQHAYFFNYIGPTGNNRDEVTMIRKRTGPGEY